MSQVENMEDLVQLDLEELNKLLGVEAGRQLHTFINHSLLKADNRSKPGLENAVPMASIPAVPATIDDGDSADSEAAAVAAAIELGDSSE